MISFVGAGIREFSQTTLEGLRVLQSADKVLTFHYEESFFRSHGIRRVESLSMLYRDGAKDDDNYQRIMEKIEADAANCEHLAVFLPGHPRVGVTILQRLARKHEVQAYAGISSFCTMINDLEVDPLEKGSVIMDVNRLLLFDLKLVPELDYYFYHVCSVGNARTHYSDPSKGNALAQLGAKLKEAYPESHRVILVGSSTGRDSAPSRIEATVGGLEAILPKIKFETSLFVPGIMPKFVNREFLARLRSPVMESVQC